MEVDPHVEIRGQARLSAMEWTHGGHAWIRKKDRARSKERELVAFSRKNAEAAKDKHPRDSANDVWECWLRR